ncbi:MAG: winged helix-turn-helix domain-containing protein [Oscillospiraceae bacterium]|nr:winged helix-turn-helix domain-containing protein [Oscillospiraceae bacterium]
MDKPTHRDIFVITAFLILVLVIWIGILNLPSPGIVDLNGYDGFYDFSDVDFADMVYAYNNNWFSYPEKLYTPEDFASGKVTEPPVLSNTLDYTSTQYFTHTMELSLPAGRTYGLFMRTADYSMRLFINGEEIDCVGLPGVSFETTTPRVLERIYAFIPQTGITTLIMQTANFVHREGAFAPRFIVGDYLDVQRRISKEDTITFLAMGCLLAASLYHLGLFALNRKRRTTLIFSLCCLLLMLITNKIPIMFPDYNWQIVFRIEYFVHYAVFVFVLLFLDKLYPGVLHKPVTLGYYIFAGLYIVALALPTTMFTKIFIVFEVVSIGLMLYVFIMLALFTLSRKNIQNVLSFVGLLVIGLFGLNDILMRFGLKLFGLISGQGFTAPLGMLFFVFCYTLVISLEYAETERRENKLATEQMTQENMNQLRVDLMLQPKEFELLLIFTQNEGKILSAEELYEAAWKAPMGSDKNAVQMTVSRLRKKIEPAGYSIQTIYGKGYVFNRRDNES